uniref:uncharacterized protein LOC128932470 n=1 Tax=Callithrix jacchus TaxID=9483 RepID=UPI0023DCEBDE|nr:uncharacterized protein LOC128932470 [Callithrix jacchus]
MVASKGEDFFSRIYSPGRADVVNFLLLPHKWPRPCHWGCAEVLTSHLLPGMFRARERVGLGRGGPGRRRPPPSPPAAAAVGAGRGLPGQRLCFPDSNYVCGSAASAGREGGAGGSLPQHPTKMTLDSEAGGGRQRRVSQAESRVGGARSDAGPGSEAPFRQQVCAAEGLPALRLGPSQARETRAGLRAPSPHAEPDSPAAATAALSCAGRREPCSRSAGRRLGAPGRRASSLAAGALLGGCGWRGGARQGLRTGWGRRVRRRRAESSRRHDLLSRCGSSSSSLAGASPPPPLLTTGWTRSGPGAEDRPPGAALRLLRRRRMRRPPAPGLPPAPAAPRDP